VNDAFTLLSAQASACVLSALNHAETPLAHVSHRRGARIALVEVDGSVAILSTAIEIPAAARCTALVHLHQLQMD
jgi:hypothetical protein